MDLELLERRWVTPPSEAEVAERAVVLGGAGSGKSTLVRYLTVRAAGAANILPLRVAIREWTTTGKARSLLEYLVDDIARTLHVPIDVSQLAQLCDSGGAVLYVDGMDEAALESREAFRRAILGFASSYPLVPLVVTSRIAGYDLVSFPEHLFQHYIIEPLDMPRLYQFIGRWYAVAEPERVAVRERRREELWEALVQLPPARELASNPLMATLLALVHFYRAELPGKRWRIYDLCIETLLETWPSASGRGLTEYPGARQRVALEELALNMQSRRKRSLVEADGYDKIDLDISITLGRAELNRELLLLLERHRPDLDEGQRTALVGRWRRWLTSGAGILQEQHEYFSFVHLSLMEYLAGQAVLRKCGSRGDQAIIDFILDHSHDAVWHETLCLLLGSRGNDVPFCDAVVQAVLRAKSEDQSRGLFLLWCVREDLVLSASVRERLEDAFTLDDLRDYWGYALILILGLPVSLGYALVHGMLQQVPRGNVSQIWADLRSAVTQKLGVKTRLPWSERDADGRGESQARADDAADS